MRSAVLKPREQLYRRLHARERNWSSGKVIHACEHKHPAEAKR